MAHPATLTSVRVYIIHIIILIDAGKNVVEKPS